MKTNVLKTCFKGTGLLILSAVMTCVAFAGCGKKSGELEVIRSVRAEKGPLTVMISSAGEVKPQNRLEIKPPIAGRVEEVLVQEGQEVKQGQVMAWMSSTERAALLDAARAQGPEALARWGKAYKPAPLVAPLDGTVIVRSVEPGQTVATTDPVVVISDRLIVNALVDETDLALIRVGQKTLVRLDAYRDRVISAHVEHISYESTLLNNVNVYQVDIIPDEVPPSFRSGMTADISFIVSENPETLLVPSEAVMSRPRGFKSENDSKFVVYKKPMVGKPVPVPVKTGDTDGSRTEILEGLRENEEIVIVRRRQQAQGGNPFSPTANRSQQPSSARS